MSEKHTITINGRQYDAITGLAVDGIIAPVPSSNDYAKKHTVSHSQQVHNRAQRSQTLNRQTITKPVTATPTAPRRAPQHIARSQAISKFAPHPVINKPRTMNDIAPAVHPAVSKAHAIRVNHTAPVKPAQLKPSQIIKNEAIEAALEKAPLKHKETKKKSLISRHPRLLNIASASLALLLLGGYFTYINLPSLSVRVAAAQAGINASYPEYHPDGYSLNGAVAFKDGEVSMKFAANGGPQNFTITQTKSSYDSEAVLDNYVKPKVGENYIPFTERGLKIYAYGGNAAWVNGGILYTINGDAPLSNSQIGNIAKGL